MQPTLTEAIPAVQFITAPDGQRLAILPANEWEAFIEWLTNLEDLQIIQHHVDRLRVGPEKSGAVPLETVLDDL